MHDKYSLAKYSMVAVRSIQIDILPRKAKRQHLQITCCKLDLVWIIYIHMTIKIIYKLVDISTLIVRKCVCQHNVNTLSKQILLFGCIRQISHGLGFICFSHMPSIAYLHAVIDYYKAHILYKISPTTFM